MKGINSILFLQNSISSEEGGGVPRVSDLVSKELVLRGYKCFFVFYEKDNEDYPSSNKRKIDLKHDLTKNLQVLEAFILENNINAFVAQQIYEYQYIEFYKFIKIKFPEKPLFFFLHANPDFWQIKYRLHRFVLSLENIKILSKNLVKSLIYPLYNPYRRRFSTIYRLSDRFILLSSSYIELYQRIYRLTSNEIKLHYIPNPLTFKEFPSLSENSQKEKIVLIVSRLEEKQKRISIALDIWRNLPVDIAKEWRLFIVGSGVDEGYYRGIVKRFKLQNVTFFGKRSDVLHFYERASIFLMTSIWEGFPMTLLEAQQNGVVPLSFDTFSSVHDIITNGESGLIVNGGDLEDYVTKLSMLMSNENLRTKMALNAIDSRKKFNIEAIVNQWECMFASSSFYSVPDKNFTARL